MMRAIAPRRRCADGRTGGDPRPRLPRARRRRSGCACSTRARRAASRAAHALPARRRLRPRRSRHAMSRFCAELARAARPAGARGRLPARAGTSLAGRRRGRDRRRALGGGQPGRARPARSPASSPAATAPAAISRSSSASPCATSRPRCRCSRNGRSTRPPIPARRGLSELRGFRRGPSADQAGHGLVRGLLLPPTRADWRYAPLVKSQAGMPPTLVTHRQPRSDPRPGPRLCRRLHRGRRADDLPRGGGQYPRLHQSAEGHPLLRSRTSAAPASRR